MRRSRVVPPLLTIAVCVVATLLVAGSSRGEDYLPLLLRQPRPTLLVPARAAEGETGLQPALEWQRLQLLDEHGRFNNRGLLEANLHRQAHVPPGHGASRAGTTGLKARTDTLYFYNWFNRGPNNAGGRTRAILVHPIYPQTIYAGAASGGLWLTTNGGTSWSPLTDRWANTAISSLAFDAGNNANIIYAGTGETTLDKYPTYFYYDAIGGVGLLKSSDGGFNWTVISSIDATGTAVHALAAQPGVANVLLAGNDSGIYLSTDGGSTWTKKNPAGLPNLRILNIQYDSTGSTVVATGHDLSWGRYALYSADGGNTFSVALSLPAASRSDLIAAHSTAQTVYLFAPSFSVYKSTNNGQSYSLVSTQSTNICDQNDVCAIWGSPTAANRVVIGGLDNWRSDDGGVTFTRISNGGFWNFGGTEPHVDQHVIAGDPNNPNVVYFGNDGGIYKAADITQVYSQSTYWFNLNHGYNTTQFYNAAGNLSDIGRFLGGAQDNGTIMTSPTFVTQPYHYPYDAWDVYPGDGGWVAIDPTNTNYLFVEPQGLAPGRSTDGGFTAFFIAFGITDHTGNFIPPMVMDPNNPATLYLGGAQLWRTTTAKDTQPSWSSARGAIGQLAGSSQPPWISAIAVAPGNSNVVWLGYDDGRVYKSTNFAATWTPIDDGLSTNPLPQRYIESIYIDPTNSDVVIVTLGGYSTGNVWRTTNGGATWTNIHGNLPSIPIRAFTRHPRNSKQFYVGGDVGVYSSSDGGVTWISTNEGPADVAVHSLNFVAATADTLMAGTHGRGMWTADVSDVPTLAPSNLVATANGTSSVSLTWSGVTGGTTYNILRSNDGGPYYQIGAVSTTSFTDTNVVASKTYLYKVNTTVDSVATPNSNVDLATTVTFTDDNNLQGKAILATHLQEIRNATNLVRVAAGLATLGFNPAAAPGVTITSTDITGLRSGLTAAYNAIGMTPPNWAESVYNGVLIKASHFQEIRNAVK